MKKSYSAKIAVSVASLALLAVPVLTASADEELTADITTAEQPFVTVATTTAPPYVTTAAETTTAAEVTETTTAREILKNSFNISFVDEETGEFIPGIEAQITVGRPDDEWFRCFESWTSDSENSHLTQEYDNSVQDFYTLIFEVPNGYKYDGTYYTNTDIATLTLRISYYQNVPTPDITISLRKYFELPCRGTYSANLQVIDRETGENFENLDCVLYNMKTNEIVAEWNTSEYPEYVAENLEYLFENRLMYESIFYGFYIKNVPEGYTGGDEKVFGYMVYDLEQGQTEINRSLTHITLRKEEAITTTATDYSYTEALTTVPPGDLVWGKTTGTTTMTTTGTTTETTTETITTTTAAETTEYIDELPETGYSGIYRLIASLGALVSVGGSALFVNNKKGKSE